MIKRALVYGVAAALGVFLWTMLEFALGFHTSRAEVGRYTGFVALIFPVAAVAAAILSARRDKSGVISFGEGFSQGLGVAAIFSLLGAVSVWLYFTAINPGFLDTPAAGDATLAGQMVLTLVSGLVVGALVSLLTAAFVRRSAPADSKPAIR